MKTIELLNHLEWFAHVGEPLPDSLYNVIAVSDWKEATRLCADSQWEDVCTEVRNELTMHLNSVCKPEFQEWNQVIDGIKSELSDTWMRLRHYLHERELPSVIADCAEWDTMHAVATEHFSQWNPTQFFSELLSVYQCGRFPCGWNGDWPDGCLFIF